MSHPAHDVDAVVKRIEHFHGLVARIQEEHKAETLISIIRQPWWTSVAEWAFFLHALENAVAQAEAAAKGYATLVEDAQKVTAQG